ncbi:MAG TPA: hypothetical protein VF407_10625 [Polyangiaceae bacterium]
MTLATEIDPEAFAVTDHHVYWTESYGTGTTANLLRAGVDGSAQPEIVGTIDQGSFAINGSVVLYDKGESPMLGELGVDGEAGKATSNGISLGSVAGAWFEGHTLFASSPDATALVELPLGGAAVVASVAPSRIAAVAATDGIAYVATLDDSNVGSIVSFTDGSTTPTVVATDVGVVRQIAPTTNYVYFTATATDGHAALYYVLPDGSGKSVVVDDYGGSFALDGSNVYFARSGSLTRLDRNTGATTVLGSIDPAVSPAVVAHGGNVYWAYGSYVFYPGQPLRPGAIVTTCK